MDDTQLRLDGNAAGGMLRAIFADDVTAARIRCASCGAIGQLGSQHLYMTSLSPGAVLRCASCEAVLLVVVHAGGRHRIAMLGLAWIEVQDSMETISEP